MTASSTRFVKPKSAARPRSIAGAHALEERAASSVVEKLLESDRQGLSTAQGASTPAGAAAPTLAAERVRRGLVSKIAGGGAGVIETEDDETLDLIGGLLDGLTIEIGNLHQELSSSMERLVGKHRNGVAH